MKAPAVVLLAAFAVLPLGAQQPQDALPNVQTIAQHTTHFATRAIIDNRPVDSRVPDALRTEQQRLLADLRRLSAEPAAMRALLPDPDPKVRTIALGALFLREDPHDLPFIATLLNDPARTILDLHDSPSSQVGESPLDQIEHPQTVGGIATAMIDYYLQAADLRTFPGSQGTPSVAKAFVTYWAARKDRTHCASWSLVKLERATRRTEPIQPEYRDDIDAALAEIGALPSPDREWTLIYAVIAGDLPGPKYISPNGELIAAAKRIGPDALMKFLLFQPFSADPDLHFSQDGLAPRANLYQQIAHFILENDRQLLRPSDAPAIRAAAFNNLTRFQGGSTFWLKAADNLQPVQNPAQTAARIKSEFASFPSGGGEENKYRQVALATTLWHIRGPAEIPFLVPWFYENANDPFDQTVRFLSAVREDARPDTPTLLKAIVADGRFDTLDRTPLRDIVMIAQKNSAVPLAEWHDLNTTPRNDVLANWRNSLRRFYGLPEYPQAAVPAPNPH